MAILEQEYNFVFSEDLRRVSKEELAARLKKFRRLMDIKHPGWNLAVITNKVNMYYFAGTMQEGALVIRPQDIILWVRRSYVRACNESMLPDIREMRSFRQMADYYDYDHYADFEMPDTVYLEIKTTTLEWQRLFSRHFKFEITKSIDDILQLMRVKKSPYELSLMGKAGSIHEEVLDKLAPKFIKAGISEAELAAALYTEMLKLGSHGIARMNRALGEDLMGIASFGKSALVPTAFDGPGGTAGTCVAVQAIGSAFRKLQPGRLVYLDVPCGVDGYNTDKTVVYYYGDIESDPNKEVIIEAYNYCIDLERRIAEKLKPGKVIEEVYAEIMLTLDKKYSDCFMNGGKFLGHSIGMTMDEAPAIAMGFPDKIQEDMVFALEPKIALPGIGMVGSENTYVITADGAVSLTGSLYPLRVIK